MGFPMLLAAIRSTGKPQWQIAELAGMSETRLSRIVRRGNATPEDRKKLSDLLGVRETVLFSSGLPVHLATEEPEAAEVGA